MDASFQSDRSFSLTEAPDHQPAATCEHLRFHQWITHELLAETQRVWSKALGREVPAEEAVEILTNVRRLAEVLLRAGYKESAA